MSRSRRGTVPASSRRPAGLLEAVCVLVVVGAVIAMAAWFLLLSHGGIGPGSI